MPASPNPSCRASPPWVPLHLGFRKCSELVSGADRIDIQLVTDYSVHIVRVHLVHFGVRDGWVHQSVCMQTCTLATNKFALTKIIKGQLGRPVNRGMPIQDAQPNAEPLGRWDRYGDHVHVAGFQIDTLNMLGIGWAVTDLLAFPSVQRIEPTY